MNASEEILKFVGYKPIFLCIVRLKIVDTEC